jgi:hypothetical protein
MARSEPFYPPRRENVDFSDMSNIPWPKKGQKLFKEPTKKTPDTAHIVVRWVEQFKDQRFLGDSFRDAADQLIEAVLKGGDGGHPDRFVYPALYLYRHAAELQLKHLIELCLSLEYIEATDKVNDALDDHDLYRLWNCLKAGLEKAEPNGGEELGLVEARISELHQVDPSGQHVRYATLKDGEKIGLALPDSMDLENLRKVFDGFWSFLEACGLMLSHHLELKQEWESEMRSCMGGYGP